MRRRWMTRKSMKGPTLFHPFTLALCSCKVKRLWVGQALTHTNVHTICIRTYCGGTYPGCDIYENPILISTPNSQTVHMQRLFVPKRDPIFAEEQTSPIPFAPGRCSEAPMLTRHFSSLVLESHLVMTPSQSATMSVIILYRRSAILSRSCFSTECNSGASSATGMNVDLRMRGNPDIIRPKSPVKSQQSLLLRHLTKAIRHSPVR